ncbi:hypothetical protein [Pseudarthrobacter sulfonivorans]|uniref:hypothetical protein n=1 Tax=Pseudarthrobacter sulfonivorans TaxID=121292 RepID=UPI002780424A|nr:hypothetical protein [Pseudarthrobacter sulfonivorans]MDP9999009.1 hypothetical protein [Pseudarthrobacter sulfonivorans]
MAVRQRRTWKAAAKAKQESKELGELRAVEPASRRSDGSPRVGPGQVYVVSSGKVFHPAWCNSVGNVWDENPKRLLVIEENTVGERKACKACDEPLQA